jgi:hypothetical protein
MTAQVHEIDQFPYGIDPDLLALFCRFQMKEVGVRASSQERAAFAYATGPVFGGSTAEGGGRKVMGKGAFPHSFLSGQE